MGCMLAVCCCSSQLERKQESVDTPSPTCSPPWEGSLQARKAGGGARVSLEGLVFLILMLQPGIVWKFSRYQTFLT